MDNTDIRNPTSISDQLSILKSSSNFSLFLTGGSEVETTTTNLAFQSRLIGAGQGQPVASDLLLGLVNGSGARFPL